MRFIWLKMDLFCSGSHKLETGLVKVMLQQNIYLTGQMDIFKKLKAVKAVTGVDIAL